MALNERRVIAIILTVILAGIAIGGGIFVLSSVFKIIPSDYLLYIYAGIWFIVAVIVSYFIGSLIRNRLGNVIGYDNASSVSFVVRLIGYIIAFIGFFVLVRVSLGAALAAGGFAGLVLGLASQDVLSNIFGGIMLVISRPYKVGDRVTISTWQYGLIAPTYPPKFFSNDFLIPGYTGTVTDISLLYTTIFTDEQVPVKIPNSIMIQAAIFLHNREERRKVRTKYEVSKDIDHDVLINVLKEKIKKLDFVIEEPSIKVLETTLNTYILAIDTICKTIYEEPPRSEILKVVMRTVRELQAKTASSSGNNNR
ncbi:mechanosensitive ion channel family protein [Saccharolobus islandicus]|uniref:Small-conductance mechanosensitive channel n=3 Tax=Saccharolobus islandicus TaxID=43080 RepID=M9UHY9_SACIS|nr:mechanosensitive ion channel family protein [Sulfolobus islandicus]ADX83828.1 MscS Mechanosensitive ion channel [Sulfolobus islandicus HVE10/4]ADX86442.1 mechanosensitive ion channel, MscS [Sulfolobus islandicus REY15A]AGJ63825.1 Small-conductance mechanosensitive channel [Sulfolobus islandicus LAL14/1]